MTSRVKIISLNVRGLRNPVKRRSIFSYLKNQKATLYCLQETFSKEDDEKIWSAEWGGQIIFSHGSEHSRGVCMLPNVNSGFSLSTVHADRDGRCIISKIKIGDEQLFVINIYAPNKGAEQEIFIRNLGANLISKTDITKIIIAGDWNGSLFPKDKCGGLRWKETNYRNSIVDLMEKLDLVGIYRKLHPNTKAFTYESKSLKLKSRIDYFLVSSTIAVNAKRAEIRPSIAPDHKAIFLSFEIQGEFKRDPGS